MNLSDLFMPTGKTLHKVVVGQSGSGKSFFLEKGAKATLKQNENPNFRLVYFSPKQEGFIDLLPRDRKKRPIGLVGSVDEMLKNMEKNTLTVFYPDPSDLEETMEDTINSLFDMKDANPEMSCTLIIDDAQVFLSSRKQASDGFRRLALLGRSRSLNAIFVSHGLILNKTLEGQVDSLYFFTLPAPVHWKAGEERYGFNPAPYVNDLKSTPYSFVGFDVRTGSAKMFSPIDSDKN
tara:strand:+ start:2780 stop:3484 length:705 start_codon:yes stop_codon:yes gene_type:complete